MKKLSKSLWIAASYLFVSIVMMSALAFWIEPYNGVWFDYIRGILVVMMLTAVSAMALDGLSKRHK